ncbi:MAG: nuclear transport factor 2 family protein [Balneolaceae bacterium]|nr:nuclear transport factor 2 family protein [Balneolaceae bacterium]
MDKLSNKQLMQHVFAEMAKGNLGPFVDIMAEDMQWSWMGTESWTRTFNGKETVINELLAAVKETLKESYEVIPHRFIAEGDFVVIEHTGKNTTPDGMPYHNRYCWVCRFSGGKLKELREYMDTELVTKTFGAENKS